jgi:phage N-6-adenine-methyltransferase
VNNALMFSKASDEWSTPWDFANELHAEFHFDLDAAASSGNAKCAQWFGPGSAYPDALALKEWGRPYRPQTVWLNPPYSRCKEFIAKAAEQARHGNTVVCLIPSRTDTAYWHAHIWDAEKHQPRPGVEIRFIKGRLKFGDGKNSAPFPSVVVIFRPPADPEAGTDTGEGLQMGSAG